MILNQLRLTSLFQIGKSFNQTLVDELIDSIIVSKSGKMEIRMKCADVIREMNILLEEGEKNGK